VAQIREAWRGSGFSVQVAQDESELLPDYGIDANIDEDRILGAEEHIARLAERDISDPSLLWRIIRMVREWMRNVGFDFESSDADICGLLAQPRCELEHEHTEHS